MTRINSLKYMYLQIYIVLTKRPTTMNIYIYIYIILYVIISFKQSYECLWLRREFVVYLHR